jgi:hypothetical protein
MNPELAPATGSTPVSGRRRQGAVPPSRSGRARAARAAAAGIALIGVVLVVLGGLKATVLAPAATTRAALTATGRPVVSTAVGLLGLEGSRVQVDVSGGSSSRPVFVGIGRAHDVDAYLAQVSRLEVTGDGDGKLITKKLGTEATITDPAGADVWVVSARGQRSASLVWPNVPGQWRLVVATDGTAAAADKITMTWSGRTEHTSAPALIAIGLVLLVGGLISLVMLGSRARLASG